MDNQRIAIIAETPYQLLNSINIAINSDFVDIDLFIGDKFSSFSSVLTGLMNETSCFKSIIPYSYNTIHSSCVFHPKSFIYQSLTSHLCVFNYDYDVVYTPVITRMTIALLRLNHSTKLAFYDEGIGSYYGKINFYNLSKKLKVLLFITGCYKRIHRPKGLYLNNVSANCSEVMAPIIQLPYLDLNSGKIHNICKAIFGDIPKEYFYTNTIFLSDPCDVKNQIKKSEFYSISQDIINIISTFDNQFVLRPHPRELSIYCDDVCVDKSGVMWEYVCSKCIENNTILITSFSSAVFSPKYLFNKEPNVIFTCFLYGPDFFERNFELVVSQIDELKKLYSCPEKIFTPHSIIEFNGILSELANDHTYKK